VSCPSCAPGAPAAWALKPKSPPESSPDARALVDALLGLGGGNGRIRCPHCAWRPRKFDRWSCRYCFTSWNTFDTRGVCPGCDHAWLHTMCISCHRWARHEEWYEKGAPGPAQ
jgi:hypothetical protein